MYFYLSLGSNTRPEQSSVEIVRHLCTNFGVVGLFPFRYTTPVSIASASMSESMFINGLAVIFFDGDVRGLKEVLVSIETEMGRDRSDPQRSVKDRTADLDILSQSDEYEPSVFLRAEEPYVHQVFQLQGQVPELQELGLAPYQRPATVNLDALTGQIVVREDELQGFHNWAESTLKVK